MPGQPIRGIGANRFGVSVKVDGVLAAAQLRFRVAAIHTFSGEWGM